MKEFKKICVSLILSFALLISTLSPAYATVTESPNVEDKVQVIYEVKFLDRETNDYLNSYKIKKIGFAGDEETEEAESFAGYTLVSENEITFTLDESDDNEVVFYYTKEEVLSDALSEAKSEIIEKIEQLNNIKAEDKERFLTEADAAETEESLDNIYNEAKSLDTEYKIQVIYEVKFLDQDTNEYLNSYKIKKIGFAGEEEREKAEDFAGYTLVSDNEITLTLDNKGNNEVVFYYKKDKADESDVESKIQVKYMVKYLDQDTGSELYNSLTKIGFAYEEILEKALYIKGYEVLSDNVQKLVLDESNEQVIVFEYKKTDLSEAKENALKTLNNFIFIPENRKSEFIEKIKTADTQDEINENITDAENLNIRSVKQVTYNVKHVDMVSGEVLESFSKIDFQSAIVEETALEFEGYGLASPGTQSIILNPDKENNIIFNYKEFDDETIPLKDFLQKKLDYKYPLIYRNTDFTGNPDGLREYLIRKIHNGDLYAKFTATKEDQEKAYWDLFNKSTYAGNVRFARNWTDPKSTGDKNTPVEFTIGFTYADTKEDMRAAENMMYDFVQKNISDDMTDLQKVHIIHDFILNKGEAAITKDGAALRQLESGRPSNSPVALMLEGRAVCEGYAMAFSRMAELAGVETVYVGGIYTPEWYFDAYRIKPDKFNERYEKIVNTSKFDKSLNHGWNLVKLDGKWYHIDTYHDDFFSVSNPGMKQEHLRFLKSDNFYIQKAGRYWNFAYTPKAEEDYYGSFDFITEFVE